jgi:hypothetical protein
MPVVFCLLRTRWHPNLESDRSGLHFFQFAHCAFPRSPNMVLSNDRVVRAFELHRAWLVLGWRKTREVLRGLSDFIVLGGE